MSRSGRTISFRQCCDLNGFHRVVLSVHIHNVAKIRKKFQEIVKKSRIYPCLNRIEIAENLASLDAAGLARSFG